MTANGPTFPQQQYGALATEQSGKRRHLNLLLWDQGENVKAIYAGTGRMPTHTLSTHRTAVSPLLLMCFILCIVKMSELIAWRA
jgi:hypothetical protein